MVVQFIILLTLSTLICRGADISKCFSESLGIRDNESRLYLRKGSLVGSENEYEAGHITRYHANHTGSDNKDPDNNTQFYLAFAQSVVLTNHT